MTVSRAARRYARECYERLLAPFGARALARMIDDGLPQRIVPPLRFLFSANASPSAVGAGRAIEQMRAQIACRPGGVRLPHLRNPVTFRDLATTISVSPRWGMFLHLCAEAFEASSVLELGACVGISGAYLASTSRAPHLITIDYCQEVAEIARETLARVSNQSEVLVGAFDDVLPGVPQRMPDRSLQVAYIDGNHTAAATLQYVDAIVPHLASEALIILDDIHLYDEMWRAWNTLRSNAGAVAINTGRFGLLVFGGERSSRRDFDLSRYTGYWTVGGARRS